MKKKNPATATSKDKEDWIHFTKNTKNIFDKDSSLEKKNFFSKRVKKIDLHGYSLNEANKKVKNFVINSYNEGYEKLLVITGKGQRSQIDQNPYVSKQMSVLKNSVPEFIKNDEDLKNIIKKISTAELSDGGEGALAIFLKKTKE